MKFLIILLFSIIGTANAQNIKVNIEPAQPVKNEAFKLIFKIDVKNSEVDPIINFRPVGIEVISKSNPTYSSTTTFINGSMKSEKTMTIAYDLISNRAGSVSINNIEVEVGGKNKVLKNKRLTILNSAPSPRNIIAVAVVSNDSPYVNEGVIVRYYVYNKVPISTMDIKKFPKLDKFLKRYHAEQSRPERVKYNGQIYTRRVVYTTQIFPSKAGKYKIDPITLSITYPDRRTNPFGGFGMGFGKSKQVTANSKVVEINVQPLPVENVPTTFTGLVGQHSFKGTINKTKLLANEPLEIKLIVEGTGALEILEAPQLINNPAVEEFETTNDLAISPDFKGTKTFEYTYLGRETTELDLSEIKLSFFDTALKRYIEKTISLGKVSIQGGVGNRYENKKINKPLDDTTALVDNNLVEFNWNPLYTVKNSFIYYAAPIIKVLAIILGFGLLLWLVRFLYFKWTTRQASPLLKSVIAKGAKNTEIIRLLAQLENGEQTDNELLQYLESLKDETELEYKDGKNKRIKLSRKFIKRLNKVIG